MKSNYQFQRLFFSYYLVLALILITEWLWVTIKICRTTRSVFALTLVSFTPLVAIAFIYIAVNKYYHRWMGIICGCFIASVPIQSWLFAMQYLKSYLYTFKGGDSLVYKIHTAVKFTVIVAYAAVLISLECGLENKKQEFIRISDECKLLPKDQWQTCSDQQDNNY